MTGDTGLTFTHVNGMSGSLFFVETVGSGAALFDYDNDGDLDVYLVQGHELPETASTSPPSDRLWRNDLVPGADGVPKLHFTDVTHSSGISALGYGMGVATGDYDNDGWTDLYVTNWGPNELWHNNRDGTFSNVTQQANAGDDRWSSSAAFLDYDRDGWLDLFIANYVAYRLEDDHPCYSPRSGRRNYCGPKAYPFQADRLLRNRGDRTFEDVSLSTGIAAAYGPGLGVAISDFNDDGWPDIYVANDGEENALWMNQGGRKFVNEAVARGCAVNQAGAAEASMGVDAADLDGDGDEDLFMTHLDGETNTFYVNDGLAVFADRTRTSRLGLPSLRYTGFGTRAFDYDNDGRLDLFVANGAVRYMEEQASGGDVRPLKQANQLFRNNGGGVFADVSRQAGAAVTVEDVSRGAAFGDIDNDGDTDILVSNNNGPAQLLRNDTGDTQSWLGLRLLGQPARRDMLGAKVVVRLGEGSSLTRRARTDGSYCSASDPRLRFGLGQKAELESIEVFWPGGEVEKWGSLEIGRYHTLVQGEGSPVRRP
jgi:hypothetical protein